MKSPLIHIRGLAVLGVLFAAPFVSCKKSIETTPYSSFTTSNFFQSTDEAYLATLGIYQSMASVNTYNWYIPLVYDADSDIEFLSPGTTTNDWREVSHYYYLPVNSLFYSTWSALYDGVNRANIVIERIPQMSLFINGSPSDKASLNRMLGEAKFLRGFYYSELVRLWGDVPFKTKSSVTGDNLQLPLTDRYTIYAQVIKDMQDAIAVLPATIATDERINKYGAEAMLARVCLFAGGYSLAADGTMKRPVNYQDYYKLAQTAVNDVIASGLYQLDPSYSQVFKNESKEVFEPKENLFESSYYTPGTVLSSGSYFGNFNAPSVVTGLYGGVNYRTFVTASFYSSFAAGDLRRDFAIARYTLDANGNRVPLLASNQNQSWAPGKWSREYQLNSSTERGYTNINDVIMRYSDVLLMKAEIDNELNNGHTADAYNAINTVRERAFGTTTPGSAINITLVNGGTGYVSGKTFVTISGGGGADASAVATVSSGKISAISMLNQGGGYTSAPSVTIVGSGSGASVTVSLLPKITNTQVDLPPGLSKDAFLQSIQNERAWELCFEGMRRADLIRWNLLGDKLVATQAALKAITPSYNYVAGTNFVKGKDELYPYPQKERDANPAITRQNPGF